MARRFGVGPPKELIERTASDVTECRMIEHGLVIDEGYLFSGRQSRK